MNESDQAIVPREGDIVEYFPGVGADNAQVTTMDFLARTIGHTVDDLLLIIWSSLFGYSRGAFIVRKVASLIGKLGLIADEVEFDEYWNDLLDPPPGPPRLPLKPHVVPIWSVFEPICDHLSNSFSSCLGVWHTTLREKTNLLTLPDDDLPEIVRLALHAVGYHENRKLIDLILFNGNNNDKQLCKQTLFPGSHSDVGIVEPERKIIADVTLDWMLRNMPQTIQVVLSEKLESEVPSWYPIKSALHEVSWWMRVVDQLHHREYLPTMPSLLWHRTLLSFPPPNSPDLPKHTWHYSEYFDSVEEEVARPTNIGRPAAKQLPPPKQPPQSADTTQSAEPQVPQEHHPTLITRARNPATGLQPRVPLIDSQTSQQQAPRPEPGTTDQADFMTDTPGPASIAQTSLASEDIPPEIRASPLMGTPRADCGIRAGAVYHIFNKKYGTGVRVPEDADQADLVGYRRTNNAALGYKWKMEQDIRNTTEYRIYNVDFKRYAKLGHSSPDSVQTGRRDDDDDDWWIIEPVLDKENCFTIAHYADPVYWWLVDKRNRTPITLRKSSSDSANHWEFGLVLE
ncbi:hypothetical protein FRC10_001404 [Ceratobasidium sp. 414]|nr:hypothetical protein FRC10_001404 [Ceratobasidium sp. 414]